MSKLMIMIINRFPYKRKLIFFFSSHILCPAYLRLD